MGAAASSRRRTVGAAVNTVAPSITGTRGGTLTAVAGTWTGASGGVTGKWYADGVDTGITASTFSDTDTSKSIEYRETALPGSVVASGYRGTSTSADDYLNNFDSYTDGTRLAEKYNTTNLTTFTATATPHTSEGWQFSGYQESGDTNTTGEAQNLRIYSGKLQQKYAANAGGHPIVIRDFGAASGVFKFKLCFAGTAGLTETRAFVFSAALASFGGTFSSGFYVTASRNGFGTDKLFIQKGSDDSVIANVTMSSTWVDGDELTVRIDATAKTVTCYQNGNLIGTGAYDITSALAATPSTWHGFINVGGSTPTGANIIDQLSYNSLQTNSVTAAINPQASGSPGKKQVDVTASIGISGATGAQFKVERSTGALLQGWTTMSYAAGTGTGSYTIPDFAYEGESFKVLVRNVGGTVKIASTTTAVNGYALQQPMRLAVNESPFAYGEGQIGSRDVFMSVAMSTGDTGGSNPMYLVPTTSGSYHDLGVLALGDTLDNYGNWAQAYSSSQLYPANTTDDTYYLCVVNGVQWQRTVATPRSGVAPDPADHSGTTSGWKRARYALASVVGRKADGWPSKLPDDTGLTISFPLPTYIPAGKSYPVTIACKVGDPATRFTSSDTSYLTVTTPDASGNFTITLLQDGTKSIRINRALTASITSAFYLSGIPSWETGSPALDIGAPYVSAPKKSDLAPFIGYRRMKGAPIERVGGSPEYKFTSANVQSDGSTPGWRYECDVANQNNLPVLKIPVPDNADDNWITAQATYFYSHLNSGTTPRVTFSNEVWNDGSYVNAAQNSAAALALGIAKHELYARKLNHVLALWRAVWGARYVSGCAEWQSVESLTNLTAMLNFENCYQNIDTLSVAPYYGGGIGSTGIIGFYAYASTAMKAAVTANDQTAFNTAVDALVRTAISDAVAAMKTIYDWLPTYSVSKGLGKNAILMDSYEAGQHLLTNEGAWDAGLGAGMGARASTMLASYKRGSLHATSMGVYLDAMNTKCPHTLFFFNYMGFITYQGWGMMDREGQTTQEPYATVKTKALAFNV